MRAGGRLAALVMVWPVCTAAQPDPEPGFAQRMVDAALATGDGRTRQTAITVEGMLWEFSVLDRLHLRFERARSETLDPEVVDILTAHPIPAGSATEVWFRVRPGSSAVAPAQPGQKRSDPQTDRIVRAIVTSGDGRAPETAFVVGGLIQAEYQVMSLLGDRVDGQALRTIRGCSFDVLMGPNTDTGRIEQVYFKLGHTNFDYEGAACRLDQQATPAP